jgi:hypothetical protein
MIMAPKGSAEEAALNRFGREVIVAARDDSIACHDAALANAAHPVSEEAGPEVKQIRADYGVLASLSPEVRAVVRRLVVLAGDTAIFYVLKYLDDLGPKLVVDDTEILDVVCGELHGLQLTEEGWFAQYSKYGEGGESAVS